MGAIAWSVGLLLAAITLRRLRFVFAPRKRRTETMLAMPARAAIAVAARNEEERIGELLDALDRVEYPRALLRIIFVDDASEDGTRAILERWCESRGHARVVALTKRLGKAAALNRVLADEPTELIVSFDADQRPAPDCVQRLVAAAADPRIGAVSGYRAPILERPSFAGCYAALESWVHQLVVQEGKDRLNADPTSSGGGCLYRRSALADIGWFPVGSLSEDVEVTLAMAAAGWRTRFVREAVVETRVASTLSALRRQRARWTVGLYRSKNRGRGFEALATSLGYADRLAFLAAVLVAAVGWGPWWLPGIYLLGPAATVLAALTRANAGWRSWTATAAAVAVFPLDVLWTLGISLQNLFRRDLNQRLERSWRDREGKPDPAPLGSGESRAVERTGERAA